LRTWAMDWSIWLRYYPLRLERGQSEPENGGRRGG
jgi:hypothetical protein